MVELFSNLNREMLFYPPITWILKRNGLNIGFYFKSIENIKYLFVQKSDLKFI